MFSYGKVFRSLWDGSLHGRSDAQLVFIYLICCCDPDGQVEIVPRAIAGPTGLPLERVQAAIAELEAPDPESRSKASDGRRLVPIDDRGWGWKIVNYDKYRWMRDHEERRQQNREAQRRHRSAAVSMRQQESASVSSVSHGKPSSAQAEAEAEAIDSKHMATAGAAAVSVPVDSDKSLTNGHDPDDKSWVDLFEWFWREYPKGRHVGKPAALRAWKAVRPQSQETIEAIGAGLTRWKASWTEDRFIPYPATFLNQRRWENEP